jgi:HEAT repeat protein
VQSDEPTIPESIDEALLRAGFADGPESAALIRSSLTSDLPRLRVLALRAAARRALLEDDDWASALGDVDAEVRRDAVNLVAYEEGTGSAVTARIIPLLDDEDPLVVDGAAFALGEKMCVEAVERLCDVAQHHDDARCREAAVAALGVIGDERGRAAVLGALDDKPPVRRRAIVALANFEGPDIDAALEKASLDRDWQVRAAAGQLVRENDD